MGPGYDLQHTVWCNGDSELYDMKVRFYLASLEPVFRH